MYRLVHSPEALVQLAKAIEESDLVAVDTETTGLDPFTGDLLLLQILCSDGIVYIVDCRRADLSVLRKPLGNVLVLMHNAKFDCKWLKVKAGITFNHLFDTMLAEKLLTAGLQTSVALAALVKKYLGEEMDKSVRATFADPGPFGFTEQQLMYAEKDVLVLPKLYMILSPKLKDQGLDRVSKIEFKCIPVIVDMEINGVKIDVPHWRKILEKVKADKEDIRDQLDRYFNPYVEQGNLFGITTINWNSSLQIKDIFSRVGVELPDTSEKTLKGIKHEGVELLLKYREYEKIISAYGEGFLELINSKTGRIHPDFQQLGTQTGRMSCKAPNIQQIPATSDFRECFIAEEGYKLVVADYSQIELRILAELSGDPGMVSAFKEGHDLHTATASTMFKVPIDQVEKPLRSKAKTINFGLVYGCGPATLAIQLGSTDKEAKQLIQQYFDAYQGVKKWLDRTGNIGLKKMFSKTLLGRKRYYSELPDPTDPDFRRARGSVIRKSTNTPIQGTSADLTKMALVITHENIKKMGLDARIVNCVHDEIVLEVREDQAPKAAEMLEWSMVLAGTKLLKKVPVIVESAIADYWKK